MFCFDFFTETTVGLLILGHVYESHTACLAGAVFIVASVSKAGPAPVSTRKSLLVVEAHAYQICQCCSICKYDITHLLTALRLCFSLNAGLLLVALDSTPALVEFDRPAFV